MVGSLSCAGCLERPTGAELDFPRLLPGPVILPKSALLCVVLAHQTRPGSAHLPPKRISSLAFRWIISSTPYAKPHILHGRYPNLFDPELAVFNTVTAAPRSMLLLDVNSVKSAGPKVVAVALPRARRGGRSRHYNSGPTASLNVLLAKQAGGSPAAPGCAGARCLSHLPQWTVTPKKTPYIGLALSLEVWG